MARNASQETQDRIAQHASEMVRTTMVSADQEEAAKADKFWARDGQVKTLPLVQAVGLSPACGYMGGRFRNIGMAHGEAYRQTQPQLLPQDNHSPQLCLRPPRSDPSAHFASGMKMNAFTSEPRPCVYDAPTPSPQIQLFAQQQVEAWEEGRAAQHATSIPQWANRWGMAWLKVYYRPVANR